MTREGFQSTPSVWKATHFPIAPSFLCTISIHAFRVEGDLAKSSRRQKSENFNPRLPCGRRRKLLQRKVEDDEFQSTPSVWKATLLFPRFPQAVLYFNPRLPCGRRLQKLTGDLLNTHIICIYVHKAVALFYNQWHRKPLSTLLFYNFFGANGTVILCLHPIRTKTATLLQHQNRYSRRSVRLWFYSYCRDNRT